MTSVIEWVCVFPFMLGLLALIYGPGYCLATIFNTGPFVVRVAVEGLCVQLCGAKHQGKCSQHPCQVAVKKSDFHCCSLFDGVFGDGKDASAFSRCVVLDGLSAVNNEVFAIPM